MSFIHVALAYTTDSRWRNRAEFFQGREAIGLSKHFDNEPAQEPATFVAFYLLGKTDQKLIEVLE